MQDFLFASVLILESLRISLHGMLFPNQDAFSDAGSFAHCFIGFDAMAR